MNKFRIRKKFDLDYTPFYQIQKRFFLFWFDLNEVTESSSYKYCIRDKEEVVSLTRMLNGIHKMIKGNNG